jgi:uncharacterized RDD family membrane protein YckC
MNIARFGKRISAYIVNLVFAYAFPVVALVLAYVYVPNFSKIPFLFVFLMIIFASWFAYTFIFTIWLFVTNGRTLGARIFGLRVVHPNISRLSFGDCFARAAAEGMFMMAIISSLYVIAVHTEKSVFDRLTDTVIADWRNRSI